MAEIERRMEESRKRIARDFAKQRMGRTSVADLVRIFRKALIWSFAILLFLGLFAEVLPLTFPESPWAYTLVFGGLFHETDVHVAQKPHNCDFSYAPLGSKGCHYEKQVSVWRHTISASGGPIISYDDGKTWRPFPADQKPGATEVYVFWNRREETAQ